MLLHSWKLLQLNYHNWFALAWWGCPPAFPAGTCSSHGWKGTDAAAPPCCAIRSLHIHSTVFQRGVSYPWKGEQLGV